MRPPLQQWWDFTVGSERWHKTPSEATRRELCRHALSEYRHYEAISGVLKLRSQRRPTLAPYISALGECADAHCGCYRLQRLPFGERPARVRDAGERLARRRLDGRS